MIHRPATSMGGATVSSFSLKPVEPVEPVEPVDPLKPVEAAASADAVDGAPVVAVGGFVGDPGRAVLVEVSGFAGVVEVMAGR
ncbi:hypothetical protein ACFQ51_33700 [Streptomyces kaempferi]